MTINLLITGSDGFIGRNLTRSFTSNSLFSIYPTTRSIIDLTNHQRLSDYIVENNIDIVINSTVTINDLSNNLAIYYSLERATRFCSQVIMFGSGAEYGTHSYKPLMDENYFNTLNPPHVSDTYSNSKFAISRLHQSSQITNLYNLRLFGVYGVYEDYTRRFISNNIYKYFTQGKLQYNRNLAFDYLFTDDLYSALLAFILCSTKPNRQTYNVCSGKPMKFSYIINTIKEYFQLPSSSIELTNPAPTTYEYSGNPSLFEQEFNHKILQTPLYDSLTPISEWIQHDILENTIH